MNRFAYCGLSILLLASSVTAQPLAGEWATEFFRQGSNATPAVILAHDGRLVIAGPFEIVGPSFCNYAAWFDGTDWRPFASEVDAPVLELVEHDGWLVALTNEGSSGNGPKRLWLLADDDWTPLSEEFATDSAVLASYGDHLYVGGLAFDGDNFVDVLHADDDVESLVVYDGLLVAGGRFTVCAGDTLGHLVAWDGQQVVRPWPLVDEPVWDLTVHEGDLVAFFQSYQGDCVRRWDGNEWVRMPFPESGDRIDPFLVFVHDDDLYASYVWWESEWDWIYHWRFRRWTGSAWVSVLGGDVYVESAATWQEGLVLGCEGLVVDGHAHGNIVHVPDPTAGTVLHSLGAAGLGIDGTVYDLDASDALAVGGDFGKGGAMFSPGCLLFDGAEWLAYPFVVDYQNGSLNAILKTASQIHGSGCLNPYDCDHFRYDGQSWFRDLELPMLLDMQRASNRIYGTSSSAVYSIGGAVQVLGTCAGGMISSLTVWDDHPVVGGSFASIGGVEISKIAWFDGSQWRGFSAPIGGGIAALAEWDGQLVVAGFRIHPDGPAATQVAVWTGEQWRILGETTQFDSTIFCLAAYHGYLVAGGRFSAVGGVAAANIAAWDGATWRPIGEGCNDWVRALAVFDDKLWISGSFRVAGGVPACRLTSWTDATTTSAESPRPAVAALDLAAPSPNPFNPRTTVSFALLAPGRARLAVYDLRGRRLVTLVDSDQDAGPHSVAWCGIDEAGRPLPSGVYLLRLESAGKVATRRASLIR